MIVKQFKSVNACKLQDELIAAGIMPICTLNLEDSIAEITFSDDVNMGKVKEIVKNHDPMPVIVEDIIDDDKIAMAEAIIDMSTQIEDLKNQINKLSGGN